MEFINTGVNAEGRGFGWRVSQQSRGKGCKNAAIGIKSSLLFVLCLHLEILVKNRHFVNFTLGVSLGRHGKGLQELSVCCWSQTKDSREAQNMSKLRIFTSAEAFQIQMCPDGTQRCQQP